MKYFNGDVKEAARLQLSLLPLINALFSDVNPIPVKEALNMMGKNAGPLRLPLYEMSKPGHDALQNTLKEYNLI